MTFMGTVLKFMRPGSVSSVDEPEDAGHPTGHPAGHHGHPGQDPGQPPVMRTMTEASAELLDELLEGFATLATSVGIERGDDLQLDVIHAYYKRHSVSRGWPSQHKEVLARNLVQLGCRSERLRRGAKGRVRVIIFPDAAERLTKDREQKNRLAKRRKSPAK